jgi:hypothetical protein
MLYMNFMLTFDTHAYIKRLISAGMQEGLAEENVRILSEVFENNVVTKQHFDYKLDYKLKELDRDMTIKMGGMFVLAVTVIATLIKIL